MIMFFNAKFSSKTKQKTNKKIWRGFATFYSAVKEQSRRSAEDLRNGLMTKLFWWPSELTALNTWHRAVTPCNGSRWLGFLAEGLFLKGHQSCTRCWSITKMACLVLGISDLMYRYFPLFLLMPRLVLTHDIRRQWRGPTRLPCPLLCIYKNPKTLYAHMLW